MFFFCHPLMWSPPYLRQGSLILMYRAHRLLEYTLMNTRASESWVETIIKTNCFSIKSPFYNLYIYLSEKYVFNGYMIRFYSPTSNKIMKHTWLLYTVDTLYLHFHLDIIYEVVSIIINFKNILSSCTWTLAFLYVRWCLCFLPFQGASFFLPQLLPTSPYMRSRWEFHHPASLAKVTGLRVCDLCRVSLRTLPPSLLIGPECGLYL